MASSLIVSATTFNFITLSGEVEPMAQQLEDITRPGVDGHAYRQVGKRGDPFWMRGVADYADLAAADAAYKSLKALQGNIGSVVDDYAITSSLNVVLLKVERERIRPVRNAVGGLLNGAGQALLIVRVRLQCTK